jgi:hypothetical protein
MDIVYILSTLTFFWLSWRFVRFCAGLEEAK